MAKRQKIRNSGGDIPMLDDSEEITQTNDGQEDSQMHINNGDKSGGNNSNEGAEEARKGERGDHLVGGGNEGEGISGGGNASVDNGDGGNVPAE
jgi:hypothetical protein